MTTTQEPMPRQFALQVRAEPRRLGVLRDELSGWLRSTGVPEELAERLVLAANEAATNCIAHAYAGVEPGPVRVSADWDGAAVTVTIADDGHWQPARPSEGPGGRGVLIMQEAMDEVRIDRTESGTTVTLRASSHRMPAIQETAEPDGEQHRVDVSTVGGTTVARLHGVVHRGATTHLRRQLLGMTCGGVVPLVVDLGGLDTVTDGVLDALASVAKAAEGAGERIVLIAPEQHDGPVLAELGSAVRVVRDPVV